MPPLLRAIRRYHSLTWMALAILTLGFTLGIDAAGLPAAAMLGALLAAIVLALAEVEIHLPRRLFLTSQSLVGCMVARSFSISVLQTLMTNWPLALLSVLSALVFSALLGWVMTVREVLPGNTAIWGTSPGALTAMVVISEEYGADSRLVALMQYMRVMSVAVVASLVAHAAGVDMADTRPGLFQDLFSPVACLPFFQSLALVVLGAWLGVVLPIAGGAMLVPMMLGIAAQGFGLVEISLPPWLQFIAYVAIGWGIGLRFTRSIVLYAFHALPKIMASIFLLLALCGAVGLLLSRLAHVDPLTAFLATCPGSTDAVAIIAASSHADLGLVMAVQVTRMMLVVLFMPPLARFTARRADLRRSRNRA